MPLIPNPTYKASFLFKNGHINSMYPFLFRKNLHPAFSRQRITTPDDDFMDIDCLQNKNSKCIFLFHGLEGSTESQYMKGTALLFSENAYDVIATNYRGCSGEMNKKAYAYNSGTTEDVDFVINKFIDQYEEVLIAGYSLGGNLVLKYASDGKFELDPKIKGVMAVSAPIDLYGCVMEISLKKNILYEKNFLRSLMAKTLEKAAVFPEAYDLEKIEAIKTLYDFDDVVTGPIHGYEGAMDYYNQCNSKQFLKNLKIPSLLITAKDDPFLSETCYPSDLAKEHPFFHLLMTKHGGHCGFFTKGKSYYWNELELLTFAQTQTEK